MSTYQTTDADRKSWKLGSTVELFITSRNKWYPASVKQIYRDNDGEWLMVSIQSKILFELTRFDHSLRRPKTPQEIEAEILEKQRLQRETEEKEEQEQLAHERERLQFLLRRKSELDKRKHGGGGAVGPTSAADAGDDVDSDSDLNTDYYTESDDASSVSSSSSSKVSLDSLGSDDDDKNELYSKEKKEDAALIVVVIERAGTVCVNGKYLYLGNQRGKPLWQKEADSKAKLYWKYDNIWTLEYGGDDQYIAYTTRQLPPSSGWESVDKAMYPSPSVILHRLHQMETIKNYVNGDGTGDAAGGGATAGDADTSIMDMLEFDFEIDRTEDGYRTRTIPELFGFSLLLNDITGLMSVDAVTPDSQADDMNLQVGDIISDVEDSDVSLTGDVDKMYKYLQHEMASLVAEDHNFVLIKFGRTKSTFPIVLVSRCGVAELDGKYSICGKLNKTYRFVQNAEPKYEISRIYYDSEEDEAVWVIRTPKEHTNGEDDGGAKDEEDEEERTRREEEQARVLEQQQEEERRAKFVDERWLFPLFKDAQLSEIAKSDDSSQCTKDQFIEYFVSKKVRVEIIEILYNFIDKKKKGIITRKLYFSFRTKFTMERMRKLLPEFCPPPDRVLKSQKAAQERKKDNDENAKEKAAAEKSKQAAAAAAAEKKKTASKNPKNTKISVTNASGADPKTVDELKNCGFKQLKDLCKKHGLPPNGTKTQLFIKLKEKLKDKLFDGRPRIIAVVDDDEKTQEAEMVKVSTAKDQGSHKKQLTLKSPRNLGPAGAASPVSGPGTPKSMVVHDEDEVKLTLPNDASDGSESGSLSRSLDSLTDDDDDAAGEAALAKFKDFYCGMSGAEDAVPPNFGWEAVEPNGIWPAPGITIYDVELAKQNLQSPVIERVVPSPNCATIHFMCDEPRIPKVCQHMACWFEVEGVEVDSNTAIAQVIKCQESPAVFTNLVNGNRYQFVVKVCSEINVQYSEKSDIVTPLLLASKPYFTNIEGKPKEMFLFWCCKNFDDKDIGATVLLHTTPIIAPPDGYDANDNGEIILRGQGASKKNVIHLTGLKTGQDISVKLKAVNQVGCMESESEVVTPAYPPPQPTIKKVIGGNREVIIDLQCNGWNTPETKCWFEVDVNPEPPTLEWLQQNIYVAKSKKKNKNAADNANNGGGGRGTRGAAAGGNNMAVPGRGSNFRKGSVLTMNRLASVRSKATFSTVLSKMDLTSITAAASPRDGGDSGDEKAPNVFGADDDEEEHEIAAYKRKPRYTSLPIIISPVINGEEYILKVVARNYTALKGSNTSDFVMPRGVPPKPKISTVKGSDGEIKIQFECDDYSTLEYRAMYEVVSEPKTVKTKTRRFNMKFRNLDNGEKYAFRARGVNDLGKGPWSELSAPQVKPLKIPSNIQELRMVPGNEEVSLYWVADDVTKKQYDGWFEITTRPFTYTVITRRQQVTFKGLVNDQVYKFRIFAVNMIGKSNKHETQDIKPKANMKEKLYKTLQRKTQLTLHEFRLNYFQQIADKEKKTKQELNASKKGKIINAQQQIAEQLEKAKAKEKDSNSKKKDKKKKKKDKKEKKKDKKKKSKMNLDLSGFAAMIEKQQSKEDKNAGDDAHKKDEMMKAKAALFSRKRHTSIMDVTRVDNFGKVFRQRK